MIDDEAFLVLNAIYLRKMASPAHIADVTGLAPERVLAVSSQLVAGERLAEMAGQLLLQPQGTADVLDYYRETYAPARKTPALADWYHRFEQLNAQFIRLVSEWQRSDGDDRLQGRVIRVVERLIKALGELTPEVPRYGDYIRRFEASVALVDQGKRERMCDPTIDSIHNVWFEFHEDILAVLGRPRDV
jgi:hypothetical protein